jgi:hypothetical protein
LVRLSEPCRDVSSECPELRHSIPRTQAQLDSSAAHQVDDCGLLRDLHRSPQRGDQDRRTDPQTMGASGYGGGKGQRLRQIAVLKEVMLAEPDRVSTGSLGVLDYL